MDETLIAFLSAICAVVMILLDGRRAVEYACLVVVIGLVGTQASAAGYLGAMLMLAIAAAGFVVARFAAFFARIVNHRRHRISPLTIFRTPHDDLFGSRSTRFIAAVIAIFAASWVSFNIPVGSIADIEGVLFPVVVMWLAGAFRLLLARSLEDVAVGSMAMSFAVGVGWNVRTGDVGNIQAVTVFSLAACLMVITAILQGRTEAVLTGTEEDA